MTELERLKALEANRSTDDWKIGSAQWDDKTGNMFFEVERRKTFTQCDADLHNAIFKLIPAIIEVVEVAKELEEIVHSRCVVAILHSGSGRAILQRLNKALAPFD